MTRRIDAGLRWWTLPSPTVDGRTVLDCHYVSRRHRAVIIDEARQCDTPSCRRLLVGHGWATLDRAVVLCGKCHGDAHRDDDEQRAMAVDAYATIRDRDQLTLDDA